jgi:hypothetical protein
LKPIYPGDELTAHLKIETTQEFELKVSSNDYSVTIVKGILEEVA